MGRSILTAADIDALSRGGEIVVPRDAIITDEARERARDRGVRIRVEQSANAPSASRRRPIALGADHGGYRLKEHLKKFLFEAGYEVRDVGTGSAGTVDFPEFAFAVARAVSEGAAWRGIMVDADGCGSAMVANKVSGVRAAACYDGAMARSSREQADANVLTLASSRLTPEQAQEVVRIWLDTDFGGGPHKRRVEKIMAFDRPTDS